MQLKTIAFLIADSLKCQEKTLFFLPYLSSLSEVYKNKIIIKSEWEAQMKSYKLVGFCAIICDVHHGKLSAWTP